MFVKHYAPATAKSENNILSVKVKVNVTRSLTLVSFERASLMEYAYQIRKCIDLSPTQNVHVDNKYIQTERTKNMPRINRCGSIKIYNFPYIYVKLTNALYLLLIIVNIDQILI